MAVISHGFIQYTWSTSIDIVLTDSDAQKVNQLLGTNAMITDPYTGKVVPYKAWVINSKALSRMPGYQQVKIGLPDRDGISVFNALLEANMIEGYSAHEGKCREMDYDVERYDRLVKRLLNTNIYLDEDADNSEFIELVEELRDGNIVE